MRTLVSRSRSSVSRWCGVTGSRTSDRAARGRTPSPRGGGPFRPCSPRPPGRPGTPASLVECRGQDLPPRPPSGSASGAAWRFAQVIEGGESLLPRLEGDGQRCALPTPRLPPLLPLREVPKAGTSEGGRERAGKPRPSSSRSCWWPSRFIGTPSVGRSLHGPTGWPRGPQEAAFMGTGYPPPTPSRLAPLGADNGGSRSIGFA
jgi:hypothetical protein